MLNFFKTVFKLALVIGLLYIFLVSIGLMGKAFKGFGEDFATHLLNSTSNPFIGLFIGILATSIIQSSSTTTSIVVGMVASGVITVSGAVPIVFGSNIGTTVTNTLVALGHISRREEFKRAITGATVHDFFNLICVSILFPLELLTGFLQKSATFLAQSFVHLGGFKFTSPVKTSTEPAIDFIKAFFTQKLPVSQHIACILMLVLSFMMLYFSLYFIVKLMKSIVMDKTEQAFNEVIGRNGYLGILTGFIFTVFVQSSSITTSIMVPLIASGILTVESVFPITMGANIGTTTTAMLASFATGNISCIIIAFVHFLFNAVGVGCIYPIKIFRQIPINLAKWLGELAFKRRRYAVFYVLGIFFVVPGILILISKLF